MRKTSRITHLIHKGYASFFAMSLSYMPLQKFIKFKCHFKIQRNQRSFAAERQLLGHRDLFWGLELVAILGFYLIFMKSLNASVLDHFLSERQVTQSAQGKILTNTRVWSRDSSRLVFDVRSDAAGEIFDGKQICVLDVVSGKEEVVFESKNGAYVGVATFHPTEDKVVFIHGPEFPTSEWSYGPYHRQGVIVDLQRPGIAMALDARDLVSPYTPGALRGGSHVHVWHARGDWVSFTYEDHVLAQSTASSLNSDINQRNIGVSVPGHPVSVPKAHPRNQDGNYFTVVVSKTHRLPIPGSDQIKRAFEEGWVGTNGYVRKDGSRQERALAFLGQVVTTRGETVTEVYVLDLPSDLTRRGEHPLEGTELRYPSPPIGVVQRRLTRTTERLFPGVQGPRHWVRSSPDGSRIAFLMKDDSGLVQLWSVSPLGGDTVKVSSNDSSISGAFDWSPDGRWIVYPMDNSICVTRVETGQTFRLTPKVSDATTPRPEACVFSPDGRAIAYIKRVPSPQTPVNQVFVLEFNMATLNRVKP